MERLRADFDVDQLSEGLLLKVHQDFVGDKKVSWSIGELVNIAPTKTKNPVTFCINKLVDDGLLTSRGYSRKLNYIERFGNVFGPDTTTDYTFEISEAGLAKVEEWSDTEFNALEQFINQQPSNETTTQTQTREIPASDRIVSRADNAWNEPDHAGEISDEDAELVKKLVREVIEEVPKTDLSNSDKSQAIARLEAAEKLANAPVPQWGKVQEILAPMEKIAVIGASIAIILAQLAAAIL